MQKITRAWPCPALTRTITRSLLPLLFVFTSLTACTMDNLPRNMKLKAFEPLLAGKALEPC